MSTVGFRDFYPHSDSERLVCIFIMFVGVSIFGVVISIFQEIMLKIDKFDEDPDEMEDLQRFFSVLKNFNN